MSYAIHCKASTFQSGNIRIVSIACMDVISSLLWLVNDVFAHETENETAYICSGQVVSCGGVVHHVVALTNAGTAIFHPHNDAYSHSILVDWWVLSHADHHHTNTTKHKD